MPVHPRTLSSIRSKTIIASPCPTDKVQDVLDGSGGVNLIILDDHDDNDQVQLNSCSCKKWKNIYPFISCFQNILRQLRFSLKVNIIKFVARMI